MSITLASNCERAYYPKAQAWVRSVSERSNVPAVFVGYDWMPPPVENVRPVRLPAEEVEALEQTFNLEHGEFLKAMPWLEPEDIVIFTNCGDVVMQRPFADRELLWLGQVPHVALGYNKRPPWDNFLSEEAERLLPRVPIEEVVERFPGADRIVCYNTGVIVGRVRFFRLLAERFIALFPLCRDTFDHQARQQFLECYVIAEMGITPLYLPPVIHAHDCYGTPPGVYWQGDTLYSGTRPVVLRHKFNV